MLLGWCMTHFYKAEILGLDLFVVQHLNSCCTTEITQIGFKTLKLVEIQHKIWNFVVAAFHWAVVIQHELWKNWDLIRPNWIGKWVLYKKTHVAWGHGLINWYCLIRRSLNIALKIGNEMMEVSVSGFFSSSRRFDYQTRLYNGSSWSFISS